MRATFKIVSTALIAAVMFVPAPVAQASEPATTTQVVSWQGARAAGLNTDCGDGAKSIIAIMRVPKGERIVNFGQLNLSLRSGRVKVADGMRINPRRVEYVVPVGSKAKVNLAQPNETYVYPVELTEGAVARIRLVWGCIL